MGKTRIIGKVKVEQIAPKIFKLTMRTSWFWYSSPHFEKAVIELGKEYKIIAMSDMRLWNDYKLVFVE